MSIPGEVSQEIGRAYQLTFIAALEANIKYFENLFTVESQPDKTTFHARSGSPFSFDFRGVYNSPWASQEVFGESKGYARGASLLQEYRLFLAKAFVTASDHSQNRRDFFWFVTNVPFGCDDGSSIRSAEYIQKVLTDQSNADVRKIVGQGDVDKLFVNEFARRVGVFILTDSYLMNIRLSYKAITGDNLWKILRRFHGGQLLFQFAHEANVIASMNKLKSPDHLPSGKRIRFHWHGLPHSSYLPTQSEEAPLVNLPS